MVRASSMSYHLSRAPFAPAHECNCVYHRFISSSAAEHYARQSQSSGRSSFRLAVYGADFRARFARRSWKGRSLPQACANSRAQVSISRAPPGRRDADKRDTRPVVDRARRYRASRRRRRNCRWELFRENEARSEGRRMNGANGMSDIEGKAAGEAASERGPRRSFN